MHPVGFGWNGNSMGRRVVLVERGIGGKGKKRVSWKWKKWMKKRNFGFDGVDDVNVVDGWIWMNML